jgi:GntR family transcriptional regulator/MocR family aminotransferase
MTKHAGGALLPSIVIDRASPTPRGAQLARALRELVVAAVLRPGDRLPSTRTLAADLGLSRTTVVDVYDQLTAEGLIVSRVGDGAYVSAALDAAPRPALPARPRPPARLARLAREASEQFFPRIAHPAVPRPFVTGTPACDAFPLALWAQLSARALRGPRPALMRYPEAGGLPSLREAIAGHLRMNRGIACAAEEVFVFHGAQDAFTRIAALFVDPGDPVWFENPGHIGARNALLAAGARLVPVPVDTEGLDVAAGLAAEPGFRLAFVTPAHQQPLAVAMSLERRLALLAAAERAGAWIVEDDAVGDLCFAGRPPPPLRSLDASGRVIHVGSFSKSLFPGLRLGFALAPPGLAEVFERIAGAILQGAATPLQATLAAFITEGHFAAHIRRMRKLYAERHDALVEAAGHRLAGRLAVRAARAGLATVGRLPPDVDEAAIATAAAARGVTVAPVSRFCVAPIPDRGLALGFAAASPREIAAGVETLAAVLADQ